MGNGWRVSGLDHGTPVRRAAHRALAARLQGVRERVAQVIDEQATQPEAVHQVRVATRRATALLRVFADALPRKKARRLRRVLRNVRKTAGAARDWHIFLSQLAHQPVFARGRRAHAFAFLAGYASARSAAASDTLLAGVRALRPELEHASAEVLQSLRKPAKGPTRLGKLGRRELGPLVRRVEDAARVAGKQGQLHQVRVAAKRLRYAMEVFVDCFEESLHKSLYRAVEELQETLGHWNDSRVAAQHLEAVLGRPVEELASGWKRVAGGIRAALLEHQRRQKVEQEAFSRWWAQWQTASMREQLRSYLE